MCKFFGWTLDYIRNMKIVDFNAAVLLYNEYIREQNKANRQNRSSKRRR